MYIAQLEHPSFASRDLQSLRTGIMSGSPCPIELMKRVVDQMGVREITIAYGLTEASPVITQTRTDDPLELRVQTVGRPSPGTGGQTRRSGERPDSGRQRTRRIVHPRTRRDARLLQNARGDGGGHRRAMDGCTRATLPCGWITVTTASRGGSRT